MIWYFYMKNNKGFAPIVILIIVGVVLVAGGAYYVGKVSDKKSPQGTSGDVVQNESGQEAGQPVSGEGSTPSATNPEDGEHVGLVTKAYEKDGKKYIDIDYYVIVTGRDAIFRELKDKENNGCVLPPSAKTEFLSKVDMMANPENKDEYQSIVESLMTKYPLVITKYPDGNLRDCLPEFEFVIRTSVNDNPLIRTFEVVENAEIIVNDNPSKFGEFKQVRPYNYALAWDTFKKLVSELSDKQMRENGKIFLPFTIEVSGSKVIKLKANFGGPAS